MGTRKTPCFRAREKAYLRNEAEEGDVTSECKDDVGHAEKRRRKSGCLSRMEVTVRWVFGAHTCHANNDRRCDAQETRTREPRDLQQRPRNVADPENDQTDDAPCNGTCSSVGQGVQTDGPGENVTGHAEDEENGLGSTKEFARHRGPAKTEWFEEHVSRICHVVNLEKRGPVSLRSLGRNLESIPKDGPF